MKKLQKIGFLLLASLFSLQLMALNKANIQVNAEGSIEVMPDYLQLTVDIEKTGEHKADLKQQVDRISQQVIDAANDIEIKKEHIEAAKISIYPQYHWQDNKRTLVGETVQRTIQIKLYDLNQYSALANALADIDITRMHQPIYGFDDSQAIRNQALVKALKHAQAKAELIANTLDRKLGKAYQITEHGSSYMPVMRTQMKALAADSAAESVAALEVKPQTVSTTVNVVFLLK